MFRIPLKTKAFHLLSRFHQTKYLNKLCITSSLVDKLELKRTRVLPPVLCLVPLAVSWIRIYCMSCIRYSGKAL